MTTSQAFLLSIVVPLYNESVGLESFHESLMNIVTSLVDDSYELIYCDDGSTDNTAEIVHQWHKTNSNVKLVKFSRNFGKENALSAGIAVAKGDAIIMLDGDGQHPVELIPAFVEAWGKGAEVVVGVRTSGSSGSLFKRLGSWGFYQIFNRFTDQKLVVGSTDFRLIDRSVQHAFMSLGETDRITRGLIDWLGFQKAFIYFKANVRENGSAGYSLRKLKALAANSFVSFTPTPLYLFGYLGVFITFGALLLGLSVIIEQLILADPWHWKFTGTAMLGILLLFLVGIVLMSQGILSLYISHIHNQSKQRPLYVIDYKQSVGIGKREDASV